MTKNTLLHAYIFTIKKGQKEKLKILLTQFPMFTYNTFILFFGNIMFIENWAKQSTVDFISDKVK
jgi:hypothetical protein